jgi:hypothetical protein
LAREPNVSSICNSNSRNEGTDSDEYTDEEEYEEYDAEEIVVQSLDI